MFSLGPGGPVCNGAASVLADARPSAGSCALRADLGLQGAWLLKCTAARIALLRHTHGASAGVARLKISSALQRGLGKHARVPAQLAPQPRPVEAGSGILFAARRDVLMARDEGDRIALRQRGAEARQGFVLRILEDVALEA